jgi:hypothetical protein
MFVVAITASGSPPEERQHVLKNTVLKAGIGKTGPFLFKLPQLLSQLFHRLVRAPFSAYALALCRFSVIC